MYIEYLTIAFVLIPLYILVISRLNIRLSTALFIYAYRAIFSIGYMTYAKNDFADANRYILGNAKEGEIYGPGIVLRIVDFSGKYLHIKGYALYALFGLFGAVGCCYLYCAIKKCNIRNVEKINNLSAIFCFVPSLTFWTLAPGKDSICFFAISFALYEYVKLNDNSLKLNFNIIISILLLFLIRPHVGASFILAYSIFYLTQIKKKKDLYIRLTILSILSLTSLIILPFLQKFASIENVNFLDSISLLEERFSLLNTTQVNANYIGRVFFYLFTPLPLIKFSPLYIADYINSFFIIYFLFTILKDQKSHRNILSNPLFIYSMILLLLLPLITFNPGVAARQKWMVLPPLIISLKKNRYLNYKKIRDSLRSPSITI